MLYAPFSPIGVVTNTLGYGFSERTVVSSRSLSGCSGNHSCVRACCGRCCSTFREDRWCCVEELRGSRRILIMIEEVVWELWRTFIDKSTCRCSTQPIILDHCQQYLFIIMSAPPHRIGLIGFGAIGSEVCRQLNHLRAAVPAAVTSILVRDAAKAEKALASQLGDAGTTAGGVGNAPSGGAAAVTVFDRPQDFLAAGERGDWTLCVEAAGQPALRDLGVSVLKQCKRPLLVTSIGALVDDDFYARLRTAAETHSSAGARLLLCSGSMPCLDWLQAASFFDENPKFSSTNEEPRGSGGRARVTVQQLKPPQSWLGTPAAEIFDLDALTEFTVLYEGPAREASQKFPKNSNVATALALASGVGVDDTWVRLCTDPRNLRGGTMVEYARDGVGTLKVEVEAEMSRANPKTGAVVPLSVVKAVRNLCGAVAHGI